MPATIIPIDDAELIQHARVELICSLEFLPDTEQKVAKCKNEIKVQKRRENNTYTQVK